MTENSIWTELLKGILKRNVWARHVPNHWPNIRKLIKQIKLRTNDWDGINNIPKNDSGQKRKGG